MRTKRPGIARADRPRRTAFAELVRQGPTDPQAFDALLFVYEALEPEGRRALIRALWQDVPSPGPALAALATIEPDMGLREELASLLRRSGGLWRLTTLREHGSRGEACLVQPRLGIGHERMRVAWNRNTINEIRIESRRFFEIDRAVLTPQARVADVVAPLLWQHIRAGRALPMGADRFAPFFGAV